jgi:hypothetical protein
MAKDIGHILSMIFMPGTPRDFLACLLDQGVIDNKEQDRLGFDSQGREELMQSGFDNLFHSPDVLPQEPGETGEGSVKKGTRNRLNHRRRVNFFAQLNEAHNEGREHFE